MVNIGALKNISYLKKCVTGTLITGDGSANILFVLLKGEVGVYRNYRRSGATLVSTLFAGDIFTDSGLLRDQTAIYSTVALSDAIILPLTKKNSAEFLREEPMMGFEILRALALQSDEAGPGKKSPAPVAEKAASAADRPREASPEAPLLQINTSCAPQADSVAANSSGGREVFPYFPAGHGVYSLQLAPIDSEYLMRKTHTCPICKSCFDVHSVRPSKLVLASTDPDLRSRYHGIEPLYYDVVTCPHCLYSALPEVFEVPEKNKTDIARELDRIRKDVRLTFSGEKTVDTVFAAYYLAILCAPICFTSYYTLLGRLFNKLSRVYSDAGDVDLELQSAKQALDQFLYAYLKTGLPQKQEHQHLILIGELYLKQGDYTNAASYFMKAKAMKEGTPALRKHAETRFLEIRDLNLNQRASG